MQITKLSNGANPPSQLIELYGKDVFGTDLTVHEVIVQEGTAWISANGTDTVLPQGSRMKIDQARMQPFGRRERLVISPINYRHGVKVEII